MSQTTTACISTTTHVETEKTEEQEPLVLRLTGETGDDERPRVTWATDTVDNEGMGKRKSKCCCIYKKKRAWNDDTSSDESDCETGNCRGHVDKHKKEEGRGGGGEGGGEEHGHHGEGGGCCA